MAKKPNQTKEKMISSILKEFEKKYPLYPDFSEQNNVYYKSLRKELKSFLSQSLSKVYEQINHDNEILVNTILETKNREIKESYLKALDDVIAGLPKEKKVPIRPLIQKIGKSILLKLKIYSDRR